MRYTFWASDCLHDFKKVLKKKDSYETRWASLFEQSLDLGLLKSFVAWWSGNTNTTMTCYGDLGIFLWDVYCNSWLPIIGEMHDESFPGAISYRAEIYEYILNFPGFWDTYIPGSPNPSSLKRLRSLCSTWWPSAAQGTASLRKTSRIGGVVPPVRLMEKAIWPIFWVVGLTGEFLLIPSHLSA